MNPTSGVQSLVTPAPIAGQIDGIAVASTGTIYLTEVTGNGAAIVSTLIQVDPTSGSSSVVSTSGSGNFFDGLATLPGGMVVVADHVVSAGGGPPTGELVQIDPATGIEGDISSGGNLINTVDVLAEPSGDFLALNELIDPSAFAVVRVQVNPLRNVISGNSGDGVDITGAGTSGNLVAGNFVGVDATGASAVANSGEGIVVDGTANNTIGGTALSSGNVVSGNAQLGIDIKNAGASGNLVLGNKVGTNATGTAAVPNLTDGIAVQGAATATTIGGTVAGAGNVISGNTSFGLFITASGTLLAGNTIGLDVTGESAIPNGSYGVAIDASGVTIGGTSASARNLISGNAFDGMIIESSSTLVEGNYVGLDATGTLALPNAGIGIWIDGGTSNSIGGSVLGAANVISGNEDDGVQVFDGQGNVVLGNWIGTNATGTAVLGNLGDGVHVSQGSLNTVGGTGQGAGNLISGNEIGVEINQTTGALVQGNLIGLDQTGSIAFGNTTGAGVVVDGGSTASTVGGAVGGARNVISGNVAGIVVTGATTAGTLVAGNLLGTDIKGASAAGNFLAGILLAGGTGTTIGGMTSLARNVISGNATYGIEIENGVPGTLIQGNYIGVDQTGAVRLGNAASGVLVDAAPGTTIGGAAGRQQRDLGEQVCRRIDPGALATSVVVAGNLIGTDKFGTTALGNGTFGVQVGGATGVVIGGLAPGAANLISGNVGAGIALLATTTGTAVQGNLIGTDLLGTNALGNGTGIEIGGTASNNTIGGGATGAGNTIAFSTGDGIDVTGGTGNTIRENSIFSDTGLGIDLGANGVTANNSAGHTGPNNYQNFPTLVSVLSATAPPRSRVP